MRATARSVWALALSFGLAWMNEAAADNPPPAKSARTERHSPAFPPLPLDALKRLKSHDPVQIRGALDDIRLSGPGGVAAAPAIIDLLRAGQTASLTQAALDTLADTEAESATEVIAWYARHRNVAVRRSATAALFKTRGAAAVPALRRALSDGDGEVRGLGAIGLGTLHAKDATEDLFAALDRKVSEAAVAIGQICTERECERLSAKLGHMPFEVVTSGLDEVLLRPGSDIKDDAKIRIVGRVREMGTAEANHFLREVQTRWPPHTSERVKQAIDQAVLATANSPGEGGRESAR